MSDKTIYTLSALATIAIFCIDLVTPLGYSTWLLYAIPLLLISSRTKKIFTVILWSFAVTALVITDLLVSPADIPPSISAVNRSFGLSALWALTFLNFRRRSIMRDLKRQSNLLHSANRELAESEANLRAIFDNSHDAIFIHELDGRIIDVNNKMLELYGVEYEEAISLSIKDDYSAADNPIDSLPSFWQKVVSGESVVTEWKGRRPHDGSHFYAEIFLKRIALKNRDVILANVRDVTERKRAEHVLKESEERLRLFIEHAPAALAMFDRNMRYVSVSRRWKSDYGLGDRDMRGQSHYEIFPEITESWKEVHRRALSGEVMRNDEDRFDRADGSVQWLKWEVRPWHNAAGDVAGIVIMSEDITERRQAEQTLRAKEAELELIIGKTPFMLVRCSRDLRFLYASRAYAEMIGRTPDELAGKPLIDIIGEEGFAEIRPRVEKVLSGQDVEYEADVHFKGVGTRSLRVANVPEKNEHGDVIGWISSMIDVTERKRYEVDLARKANLLNIVYDAIFVRTWNDDIFLWNRGAEKLYGWSQDEVSGRDPHGLLKTKFPMPLEKIRAQLLMTGSWEGELEHTTKGESRIVVDSRWSLIKDSDGNPVEILETNRDITERKRAELRLRDNVAALTRIHALSGRLLEAKGIQPLLQEVMDAAVAIMKAQRGTLQLIEGGSLRIVAHHGHQQPFLDFFASAETAASVCGEAMRCGERVIVPDIETSSVFAGTTSLGVLREAGVRAVQSTPLRSRTGVLLGILTTQWSVPYTPNEHDLWRIDLLARQAADLIESAKAGQALRAKEAELELIISKTPFMLTRCSRDLRYLYVSRAYAEMVSRTQGEIAGKFIVEVMGKQGLADILPRVNRVLAGHHVEYEADVHFQGIGARSLRVAYVPDTDGHGKVVGWIASMVDVTERKQAQDALRKAYEELEQRVRERTAELTNTNEQLLAEIAERTRAEKALNESEERYRALVSASSEVLYRMSPDWSEMRQLQGGSFLADTEKPNRNWLQEYIHPEDQKMVLDVVGKAVRTGTVFELEHRVKRQDGTLGWTFSRAVPMRNAAGRIVEWFGAASDHTDRKEAAEELRKSKDLSDALNSIDRAIHSTLDIETIMKEVIVSAATVLKTDSSSIGLLENGYFVMNHTYNMPEEFATLRARVDELKGFGFVASKKDVVAFNDAMNDKRLNVEAVSRYGVRSMAVAPFVIRGAVLGAMGFYCYTPHLFSDAETDFLRKLSASLSLALENARLFTERKKMEEDMRHVAHHDSLTGLPNRRLFIDIIHIEREQAHRDRTKMAVLFLDLDRFKEVNDTLGHDAGDMLLKEAASRIKLLLRKSDTIARIGGDEFNIILSDMVRSEHTADIANNIIDSFRKPFHIKGHSLHITTSIGISIYPDDDTDIDTLLKYADIAMYHAKEFGRNKYHFYDHTMNVKSLERMRLESMLKRSLDLDEMTIYYQPLVDIKTGRIVCSEALSRWRHPEKGLLDPKEFIPAAEETGFINALGEWSLKTVCRQVRSWIDAGSPPICVTVNLSARQFQDPNLVNKVSSILKETALPPGCLDLEITETTAMSDVERSVSRLKELSQMGISISIDDFGTGYSSLNYLKRLPIDRLKIDKSFVQDIGSDSHDRMIVQAVIAMAHNMNMKVVAEGVETEEQFEFLKKTGCDEMQGFLFSEALPADRFKELIVRAA